MKRTTGQNRSITRTWRPATQAVRGGTWRSEQGETSEAIFVSSGYSYDDAETVAARFAGEQARLYAVHGRENILADPYYNPSLTKDREDFSESADLRNLKYPAI